MKKIDINNIQLNADIFVIPNQAAKLSSFFECVQEEKLVAANQIAELNGFTFDPEKDYFIETWMVCAEHGCDNFADHCIHYKDDDGTYYTIGIEDRYLPSNLFVGKKEGDMITIKLPVWYVNDAQFPERSNGRTVAEIQIKLNQSDYRYRRFGTFEEVLKKVMY